MKAGRLVRETMRHDAPGAVAWRLRDREAGARAQAEIPQPANTDASAWLDWIARVDALRAAIHARLDSEGWMPDRPSLQRRSP